METWGGVTHIFTTMLDNYTIGLQSTIMTRRDPHFNGTAIISYNMNGDANILMNNKGRKATYQSLLGFHSTKYSLVNIIYAKPFNESPSVRCIVQKPQYRLLYPGKVFLIQTCQSQSSAHKPINWCVNFLPGKSRWTTCHKTPARTCICCCNYLRSKLLPFVNHVFLQKHIKLTK